MLQPHSSTLMLGNRSNPISFGRTGLPKLHHTAGAVKTSTPTRQHQRVGANNTAQQHQSQPVQHPSWTSVALQNSPNWMNFCGSLFACGAVSGTLLDGIHSSVGLQVYDVAPITVGGLETSLIVPPLLGIFYVVLGFLTCIADNVAPGKETAMAQQRSGQGQSSYVALCFSFLAVNLYISAKLFEYQFSPQQIFATLSLLTAVNWAVFDRTKQGIGLAVVCGLGAPAAELVLMAVAGVWHYSRPDVAGVFVSWVPLCYAFYVPAVSNLARFLWQLGKKAEAL